MLNTIRVGTLSSRKMYGINSVEGPHLTKDGSTFTPNLMDVMSVREMLDTEFSDDRHFTCYNAQGLDEWPRLNKPSLPSFEANGSGIVLPIIAFDWDTPDHIPWTSELLEEFYGKFFTMTDDHLKSWACVYNSAHGARVIYVLSIPAQALDAERYIATMMLKFKEAGIAMDPACKDWTRIFRCPHVLRDGKRTIESDYAMCEFQDSILDLSTLKKSSTKVIPTLRNADTSNSTKPCDPAEYMDGVSDLGNPCKSDWYKDAKKALKSTAYYDSLFKDNVTFAQEGERNDVIMKALGKCIPIIIRRVGYAKPEHVYSLFHDPILTMEGDWLDHMWNAILSIWPVEIAKLNLEREKKAKAASEGLTAREDMISGMSDWCDSYELHDEELAEPFLERHMFANVAGTSFFFCMQKDGTYSPVSCAEKQIITRVRTSFLDNVLETKEMGTAGMMRDIPASALVNNHATLVSEVSKIPQLESDGYIENLDEPNAVLKLPMYRRNAKLAPTYNNDVAEWLAVAFGVHCNEAEHWIANALAFEEGPICALSITAAPGFGKKLLAEGLAECLENPVFATSADFVADYNEALGKTPFLIANESFPKKKGRSLLETFKELTAGDKLPITEKYKPKIMVSNPVRIIMTANNQDMVRDLLDKDPTADDKEAIGQRLLHFNLGSAGAEWLAKKGGNSFTARKGNRWIADVRGHSDYVLAKHFLWLYKNRKVVGLKDRYLVSGNCSGVTSSLSTHITAKEATADIITALLEMIERKKKGEQGVWWEAEKCQLLVTVRSVCMEMEAKGKQITHEKVIRVFRSITVSMNAIVNNHKDYHELDTSYLYQFAKSHGLDAPILRSMIVAQDKLKTRGRE